MNKKIQEAMYFAEDKHKGQMYGKRDYYKHHCVPIYNMLKDIAWWDTNLLTSALLHDTIEDTDTTYEDLVELFGTDVANLVLEVTNPDPERKNYFPNLKTQRGHMLKFADRLWNISNMECWDNDRKETYLSKSIFWEKE